MGDLFKIIFPHILASRTRRIRLLKLRLIDTILSHLINFKTRWVVLYVGSNGVFDAMAVVPRDAHKRGKGQLIVSRCSFRTTVTDTHLVQGCRDQST